MRINKVLFSSNGRENNLNYSIESNYLPQRLQSIIIGLILGDGGSLLKVPMPD